MTQLPTIVAPSKALSLLSASEVRTRAHEMLETGLADRLSHFTIDLKKLDAVATFVADVIRSSYPTLNIPLHARWRHFVVAGRDVWRDLAQRTAWADPAARARAEFDLAIISVLLDAGAGPDWRYRDASGSTVSRSEGLALASLRMFEAGQFSSHDSDPLRVDADKLQTMTLADLASGFQVDSDNPMSGLEGRVALLNRLGKTLVDLPHIFAKQDTPRPGGLFDHLLSLDPDELPAPTVLREVLKSLGAIWPGRINIDGISLGDTWRHSAIKRNDATDGLMPLHKLSQWLTYSLIEPLQNAGMTITDLDGLTGLAEYRNGGLFIDTGVLIPRDSKIATQPLPIASEPVVEWRALTIALLDRLAPVIRQGLGASPQDMPLGSILEGGTWAVGRKIARQLRSDGGPPLDIVSDGTVF